MQQETSLERKTSDRHTFPNTFYPSSDNTGVTVTKAEMQEINWQIQLRHTALATNFTKNTNILFNLSLKIILILIGNRLTKIVV